MDATSISTATKCLVAAYEGTMDFPTIVGTLMEAGFEGYDIDYRRETGTYFLRDAESLQLPLPKTEGGVAAEFHASRIEQAVREAQGKVPGYTYAGFCTKVKAAGCAGYMVSFSGRRVVYFGRTAQTHVEYFPK